jgi:hypothetical protein
MRTSSVIVPFAVAALLLAFAFPAGAFAQPVAESQPASEPASAPASAFTDWGAAKGGLQVSIAGEAAPAVGGEFELRAGLRNSGASAVKLPAAGKVVGWFLVGQQGAAEDRKFYTQRYYLAVGIEDWPAEMEAGREIVLKAVSIGDCTVYSSKSGKELLAAYVSGKIGADLPPSEGRLVDVLGSGPAAVRLTLLLTQPDGQTMALNSNTFEVTVNPRPLAAMNAESRKAYTAELLKSFDKDAWAAKKAHDESVVLGKDFVPDLIVAARERKRPDFSRMWLATTLADIRDDQAAAALTELLEDPLAGVRNVVAFHGPKQKNDKLDAAIIAKVEKGKDKDPDFAGYAVLGFVVFRGTAPEALLKLTLDSPDARIRGALTASLKNRASPENLARLMKLLADPDEKIRAASARMLQQLGKRTPDVFRAIVAALDLPGEIARRDICKVLGEMAGISAPYDPAADSAARAATLKTWKDWIAKAPRPPG